MTVPLLAPVPLLVTVIEYVAPVWPWVKLPVWDLAIVRSGTPPIFVTSDAELLPVLVSPPPETETEFVMLEAAFPATLTVNVIVEDPEAAMTLLDVQVTV